MMKYFYLSPYIFVFLFILWGEDKQTFTKKKLVEYSNLKKDLDLALQIAHFSHCFLELKKVTTSVFITSLVTTLLAIETSTNSNHSLGMIIILVSLISYYCFYRKVWRMNIKMRVDSFYAKKKYFKMFTITGPSYMKIMNIVIACVAFSIDLAKVIIIDVV